MHSATRQRLRLSGGTDLSFITAGEAARLAVLLLHGSPSSARMFREVIPHLSPVAYVIAPDLPGFGESDVLQSPSFPAFGQAISELLERLSIGPRYIYLHDYGVPVGLHIAMQAPERVLGLIVQNANAHRTGLGRNGMRRKPPTGRNRPRKTRRPRLPISHSKGRAIHTFPVLRRTWSRACPRKAGRTTGGQ
jgi:pimeloyl-ACP methyl ester carboxylesterase